ncbi:hypothetical protein M758_9G119200 [Ceratodon purpureus]|nr:hypothetical protein M758_9G119200 [Ceratodon purpureus]
MQDLAVQSSAVSSLYTCTSIILNVRGTTCESYSCDTRSRESDQLRLQAILCLFKLSDYVLYISQACLMFHNLLALFARLSKNLEFITVRLHPYSVCDSLFETRFQQVHVSYWLYL